MITLGFKMRQVLIGPTQVDKRSQYYFLWFATKAALKSLFGDLLLRLANQRKSVTQVSIF